MAPRIFHRSFNSMKCNTSLKFAVSRLKILINKKKEVIKQLKMEVSHLLEAKKQQSAMIRIEHVVREEKMKEAYEFIELYCELIIMRMKDIEKLKSCPNDLKEAICSLIFVSPRCADLPELHDSCKQFEAKYGKEFVNSSLELRPGCGVNHTIVEKLSAKVLDGPTKIKLLSAIAREYNVIWEPEDYNEGISNPPAEYLNGPVNFESASKLSVESPDSNFLPSTKQLFAFSSSSLQNVTTSSSPVVDVAPSSNFKTKSSGSGKDWNARFEDATAAAQAAAESAEMASIAAKIAAELASRGIFSRQSSSELEKKDMPKSALNHHFENLEDQRKYERINRNQESIKKSGNDSVLTRDTTTEDSPQKSDQSFQGEFSSSEIKKSTERTVADDFSSNSHCDLSVSHDSNLEVEDADMILQKRFSELEADIQAQRCDKTEKENLQLDGSKLQAGSSSITSFGPEHITEQFSESTLPSTEKFIKPTVRISGSILETSMSKYDEENENPFGFDSVVSEPDTMPSTSVSNSRPVFDDYETDKEEDSQSDGSELPSLSIETDVLKLNKSSESFTKLNLPSELFVVKESLSHEHSETNSSCDSAPPVYDDIDKQSSESEMEERNHIDIKQLEVESHVRIFQFEGTGNDVPSSPSLNFQNLKGGLRHRNHNSPTFTSLPSNMHQKESEKRILSSTEDVSLTSENRDEEIYGKKPQRTNDVTLVEEQPISMERKNDDGFKLYHQNKSNHSHEGVVSSLHSQKGRLSTSTDSYDELDSSGSDYEGVSYQTVSKSNANRKNSKKPITSPGTNISLFIGETYNQNQKFKGKKAIEASLVPDTSISKDNRQEDVKQNKSVKNSNVLSWRTRDSPRFKRESISQSRDIMKDQLMCEMESDIDNNAMPYQPMVKDSLSRETRFSKESPSQSPVGKNHQYLNLRPDKKEKDKDKLEKYNDEVKNSLAQQPMKSRNDRSRSTLQTKLKERRNSTFSNTNQDSQQEKLLEKDGNETGDTTVLSKNRTSMFPGPSDYPISHSDDESPPSRQSSKSLKTKLSETEEVLELKERTSFSKQHARSSAQMEISVSKVSPRENLNSSNLKLSEERRTKFDEEQKVTSLKSSSPSSSCEKPSPRRPAHVHPNLPDYAELYAKLRLGREGNIK